MVQKIGSRINVCTRNSKEEIKETISKSSSLIGQQQQQQQRKRFMGVRQSPSGRWVAEIKCTVQKIRLWLGTFDTPEEAAHAYDEAACLLRGSKTRTNFWPRTMEGFGRSFHPNPHSSSVLSAKVLNHLLNHLETQKAAKSPQHSSSKQSKLALLSPPPLLLPPQLQQLQHKHNQDLELITRMAYTQLFCEVSTSGAITHSGDEREHNVAYENNIHDGMDGKVEAERVVNLEDMDLRLEDFSYFFAPCEIEERERVEIKTYDEYWSTLFGANK